MILTGLKNANLAALGYWGFQTGPTLLAKIGLGIGAPALAVLVRSQFGAPRSARQLRGFPYLLLKVVFFGSGALALFAAGNHILAVAFNRSAAQSSRAHGRSGCTPGPVARHRGEMSSQLSL